MCVATEGNHGLLGPGGKLQIQENTSQAVNLHGSQTCRWGMHFTYSSAHPGTWRCL